MHAEELKAYFKSVEQSSDGLIIQMPDQGTRYLLYVEDENPELLNYNELIKIEYGKKYSFSSRHMQINFQPNDALNSFKADIVKDLRSFGGKLEKSTVLVEPDSEDKKGIILNTRDSSNIEIPPIPPKVAVVVEEPISIEVKSEPAPEKPAEVAPADVAEEPTQQPSQWWLWLVGAVIIIGGLALVKSNTR